MFVLVDIVGMRYRNLPNGFIESIDYEKVELKQEPENEYSSNAVQCIYQGLHFGYVSEENAKIVFDILSTNSPYKTQLLEQYSNTVICLSIDFDYDVYPEKEITFSSSNDDLLSRLFQTKFDDITNFSKSYAWTVIASLYKFVYEKSYTIENQYYDFSEEELNNFNFPANIELIQDLSWELISEFSDYYESASFTPEDEKRFAHSFEKTFPEHHNHLNGQITIQTVFEYLLETQAYFLFLDTLITEDEFGLDLI